MAAKKNVKEQNGEGNVRQLKDGSYECLIQSKYLNPKTGKPKRIKRKAATEKEAREKAKMDLAAWEKDYERGSDTKIDKKRTFDEYMDEFVDMEVKSNITASGYHTYIRALSANFYNMSISKYQLQMLNAMEFQKYYDELMEKKARKTCLFPRQLCIRCCQRLVDRSLLKENYAKQAILKQEIADEYDRKKEEDLKKRKKVFTSEDIQKFYYAYKNDIGQYPVVVLFLLETGMRSREFSALWNDNIDLNNNKIHIVEAFGRRFKNNDKNNEMEYYTKVPKNKEARYIIMSDLCRECVLYMMEQTKLKCKNNPENLLYPSFRSGKRRSASSMETCFKELCDRLEIERDVHVTKTGHKKGLCLHSLRHTADTIANTAKGANVVNTALMMGHKAISVENHYTHATDDVMLCMKKNTTKIKNIKTYLITALYNAPTTMNSFYQAEVNHDLFGGT